MAARTTSFATGPRMIAFRALEDVLREAPSLKEVRTFTSWTGEGVDKMPLTSGMFPYLGITPVQLPNELLGEGRTVAVIGVRVEIATSGLVAEDFVNFWDAVEDAIVKGRPFRDTNVFCYLQQKGIFIGRSEAPPLRAFGTEGSVPSEFLAGAGLIILRLTRPS